MNKNTQEPHIKNTNKQTEKQDKRANALRDNLMRRKQQKRAQSDLQE